MRKLDVLRAGDMSAAFAFPSWIWTSLVNRMKSRINRNAVARLDGFSDHELADIGLSRRDVETALAGAGFFDDPSRRLAHIVRGRRQA